MGHIIAAPDIIVLQYNYDRYDTDTIQIRFIKIQQSYNHDYLQ